MKKPAMSAPNTKGDGKRRFHEGRLTTNHFRMKYILALSFMIGAQPKHRKLNTKFLPSLTNQWQHYFYRKRRFGVQSPSVFNPAHRVVKYNAPTKMTQPFPNEEWNTPRETDDQYLSNILGIRKDENGIVRIPAITQKPQLVLGLSVNATVQNSNQLIEDLKLLADLLAA